MASRGRPDGLRTAISPPAHGDIPACARRYRQARAEISPDRRPERNDRKARFYFRPKSAGISPHSSVSHFRTGVE